MQKPSPFAEVLEAVEHLSPDEQEALLQIVRRRMAERGRKRLAAEIRRARKEFAQGRCKPATVEEIMREILS
jgi:hypothetical protein